MTEPGPSVPERVRQLHLAYLDTLYATEFYKEAARRGGRTAKWLDALIAIGGTGSGGSGLGAIGTQIPGLVWLCALLTAAAFCLSATKAVVNWSDTPKRALESVEKLGYLSGRYLLLIEKLNAYRAYTADDERIFSDLRRDHLSYPAPQLGDLPEARATELQERILRNTPVDTWWKG